MNGNNINKEQQDTEMPDVFDGVDKHGVPTRQRIAEAAAKNGLLTVDEFEKRQSDREKVETAASAIRLKKQLEEQNLSWEDLIALAKALDY